MDRKVYQDMREIIANDPQAYAKDLLSGKRKDLYGPDAWKPPSKEIIANFSDWESKAFARERNFYNGSPAHNSSASSRNLTEEVERIAVELSKIQIQQEEQLEKGQQFEAYYSMAQLAGKLNYMIWVYGDRAITKSLSEYLRELAYPKNRKLTYSAIALLAIYKNVPCSYKEGAEKLLREYNKELKSYKSLILHYKKLSNDNGITKDCTNPNTKKQRIIDIESILNLLSDAEKKAANAHLAIVQNKRT